MPSRCDGYHYTCLKLDSDHAWGRLHQAILGQGVAGAEYIPSRFPKTNTRLYRVPDGEIPKLPTQPNDKGTHEPIIPMDDVNGWHLYNVNPFADSPAFTDLPWNPVE